MAKSLHILHRQDFTPRPGFRATVHRAPEQEEMTHQHGHDFYEVVWILAGSGVHVTGQFRHRVRNGDVLVLDPRRAHGYERSEGLNLINVLLDPGLMPDLHRAFGALPGFQRLFWLAGERWDRSEYRGHLRLTGRDAEDLSHWIDRLDAETRSDAPEASALAEGWVLQLVGLLSRRAGGGSSLRGPDAATPSGLHRLFSWMELHLEDPLSVADLAREAGMSLRTFQRRFRDHAGQSPSAYLTTRRMARATRLLQRQPDLPISEIAARCGYPDSNHFSTTVRKHFGASPRELARQNRKASA